MLVYETITRLNGIQIELMDKEHAGVLKSLG